MKRRILVLALLALAAGVSAVAAMAGGGGGGNGHGDGNAASKVKHIVVIYEENHSFDNLYGGWEGVNGRVDATPSNTIQISQAGVPFTCLLQNDVNLTAPPLPLTARRPTATRSDKFANAPFNIDGFLPTTAQTCPQPGASSPNGSCRTRRTCRAAALATSCTASIRSSTSSTAASRTAT